MGHGVLIADGDLREHSWQGVTAHFEFLIRDGHLNLHGFCSLGDGWGIRSEPR